MKNEIQYISKNFVKNILKKSNPKLLKTIELETFCDSMHQTNSGHKLIAHYLAQYLLKNNYLEKERSLNIWFFGGSTTISFCMPKSMAWPEQIKKILPNYNIQIKNFGKVFKSSNYSIPILNHNLKNNSPDLIIWGHFFNEYLIHIDTLMKHPSFQKSLKQTQNPQVFLLKLHNSLYRGLQSYYFLTNFFNFLNKSYKIHDFLDLKRTKKIHLPSFISILYKLFKKDLNFRKNYLKAYKFHLNEIYTKISKTSKRENIKLLYIRLPYIEDYYKKIDPSIHETFKKIYDTTSVTIEDTLKKNEIPFYNLHQQFHHDFSE